jgi:hypothetical protein
MRARKNGVLFVVMVLALTSAACNLTNVAFSTPPPGLFDTPTAGPTQPLNMPTSQPSDAGSTQSAPVVVVATSANPALPPAGNASPTPPPTVSVTLVGSSPTKAPNPPAAITPNKGDIRLKIYMIAVNDNGAAGPAVGCGDSTVPVTVQVPYTQAVLRTAIENLLAVKGKDYGQSGLYNALYQSNLTLDSLALQNGEATIRLKGQLASGGVCDDPRIIAQIERTALQFSTVNKVSVYVNGTDIHQLLSGR